MNTGKGAISYSARGTAEVVYDYPDRLYLQEYRPMNDRDIELKECIAYEKLGNEQSDIELVKYPAYAKKQRSEHQSPCKQEECPNHRIPSLLRLKSRPLIGVLCIFHQFYTYN
jgi:hypothetical protein